NSCGQWGERDDDGGFVIDQVTPTSFRVVTGDGKSFACALTGLAFDCPDRYDETITNPGLDAALHIHATATGTFTDPAHGRGTQKATATCTGTQCSLAPVTFPCTAAV